MRISVIGFGPVESKSNGYFIRSHHIVTSLANLNHNVLVLEFSEERSSDQVHLAEGIRFVHVKGNESCTNSPFRALTNVLTFDPLHLIKFQLYSLIELIRYRHYLKRCDFVFVEGALIPFAIIVPNLLKKKVVLDTQCVNKLLAVCFKDQNRLVYFARFVLWDLLERFATRRSDEIIVVSEEEKNFVQKEYRIQKSKIHLILNVIRKLNRSYSREELNSLKEKWALENKTILTFVGNLHSVQNRCAIEYIINDLAPLFWRERKDVVFLIIGKGKDMFRPKASNVILTDFVEDISPYLEISDICIAPLSVGAGTKTKVLDYLAHGKTTISTPIGVEGIKLEGSKNVFVSDMEHFGDTVIKILDNNTREELEGIGNSKTVGSYSYEVFEKALEGLFHDFEQLR